jgi:signal transduction histidine kinase
MRTGALQKLGINKLWVRLTVACTLVTLIVPLAAFLVSAIGLRVEIGRYVKIQFSSMPDSVGKQLSAYYQQSDGWDGVNVLLEHDVPLSVALVTVADSGQGIAPEHLDRVFDRFWRADRAHSREDGGSGLGLAVAKSLVEAHGGRIWAESTPGQGATFTFELPTGSAR